MQVQLWTIDNSEGALRTKGDKTGATEEIFMFLWRLGQPTVGTRRMKRDASKRENYISMALDPCALHTRIRQENWKTAHTVCIFVYFSFRTNLFSDTAFNPLSCRCRHSSKLSLSTSPPIYFACNLTIHFHLVKNIILHIRFNFISFFPVSPFSYVLLPFHLSLFFRRNCRKGRISWYSFFEVVIQEDGKSKERRKTRKKNKLWVACIFRSSGKQLNKKKALELVKLLNLNYCKINRR